MVVATPGTTATTPGTSPGIREEHGANMGLNYQQLRHWSKDRYCGRTYSRKLKTVITGRSLVGRGSEGSEVT